MNKYIKNKLWIILWVGVWVKKKISDMILKNKEGRKIILFLPH